MATASRETGLDDYGDDQRFVEGLRCYVNALREEAQLTPTGEMMQVADINRMLVNRLRHERDLAANPEIAAERIVAPIVIVGLPRTGTTKLQRMMSADPGVQRLDVWRLLNPAPFPEEHHGDATPRLAAAQVTEQTLAQMFPEFMARHPTEAAEPDEELLLMEPSFQSTISAMRHSVPSFRDFAERRGPRAAYEYMVQMLQYLQWQDGGGRGRPWIMKSPIHTGNLALLFELFPDATVVHCHRDPRTAVTSFATLTEITRRMASDCTDVEQVGAQTMDTWAAAVEANLADRATLGEDRIVDIDYERIREEPEHVITEIYARAQREFSPSARAAMRAYDTSRPQHFFGSYENDPERFGYTDAEFRERFAGYYARFRDQVSAPGG